MFGGLASCSKYTAILLLPAANLNEAVAQFRKDWKEKYNQDFRIASVRYDPWNADLLSQELEHRGYQMEEVRANSANAVLAPTVELERYFHRGLIRVPQNPCLKWCFQNAVLRRVGSDGVIINKAKSTARVDAAVASVLAMSGWMAAQDTGLADASWISFA